MILTFLASSLLVHTKRRLVDPGSIPRSIELNTLSPTDSLAPATRPLGDTSQVTVTWQP